MVDKIVYGSVCSGVEAASVAWEPLGFKPAWFAEIEPFPSAVLKYRFPNVPNLGDMTKIYEKEAFQSNDIDLLVGGTPCQSFSVAGLRKGLADPRGNLALEFLRIVDTKRPRWVLWENVPGVLSSLSHDAPDSCLPPDGMEEGAEWVGEDEYDADESHAFSCFLAGLQELGYGVAYRIMDAQYFGVPQRRRRVFVVGYLGDWRPSFAVLFERGGVYGHSPKSRKTGKEATGAAGMRIDSSVDGIAGTVTKKWSKGSGGPAGDECYNLVTYDTTQLTSNVNSQNRKPGDPCHTLAKNGDAPLLCYVDSRRDGVRENNNISPTIEKQWGTGGNNVPIVETSVGFTDSSFGTYTEGCGTLRKNGGGNGGGSETLVLGLATLGHTESNGLGVGFSETANTLEKTGSSNQAVILKKARRLTPMECERLQGFPSVINRVIFSICFDHQKNCVVVETKSLKLQNNASLVEESERQEYAKCAEMSFDLDQEKRKPLAVVRVQTDHGQKAVATHNLEKSLSNASGADKRDSFLQFMQQEGFAQAVVRICQIVANQTQDGKEALLQNMMHSTPQQHGRWLAAMFGLENKEYVNSVANSQQEVIRFITLNYGHNLQNFDSNDQTWLYFVLDVISSFIQKKIQKEDSFEVWLEVESGWTNIPWKNGFSPDSLRYQAMGNSMAVPVMRWFGRRIQMVDEVIKTKNT